jgi:phage-related protein
MSWKVKFFQTRRGDYPVKDFIERLDKKTYSRALKTITLLHNFGPFMRMPYSKKITSSVLELRIKGAESIRILYSPHKQEFYLLHAFKKKTQKIPRRELEIALDRSRDLT